MVNKIFSFIVCGIARLKKTDPVEFLAGVCSREGMDQEAFNRLAGVLPLD